MSKNLTDAIRDMADSLAADLSIDTAPTTTTTTAPRPRFTQPERQAVARQQSSTTTYTGRGDFLITTDRSGTTLHLVVTKDGSMCWAVAAGQATSLPDPDGMVADIAGALRLRAMGHRMAGRFHAAATTECMARNLRRG
jgi:hypothetical protein